MLNKIFYRLSLYLRATEQRRVLANLRKNKNVHIDPNALLGSMNSIIMETAGCSLFIDQHFFTRSFCLIRVGNEGKLKIGKNVFFNNNCSVTCMHDIVIGENVMLGEGVKIYDHNHAIEKNGQLHIKRDQLTNGKVSIGKNSWLGANVIILKGVIIGENVVIGANCLIYKNIPSNSIVKCSQELSISQVTYGS